MGFPSNFTKKDFTVLLCGVGNESTAELFIEFVKQRSPQAKIIIIDLGEEQIAAVKKLVEKKYAKLPIFVKQINALALQEMLATESIDWIETDGFLEFFDHASIQKILAIWFHLLKKDGFITTRMPVYNNHFEKLCHKLAKILAKRWLGVNIFYYKTDAFNKLIEKNGLVYVRHTTLIPTLDSYTMIKHNEVFAKN